MGNIKIHETVKLIVGITYKNEEILETALEKLSKIYGKTDNSLKPYSFNHTEYYKNEMGENLKKLFISFENLINPEMLPEIKIQTNKIEEELSEDNKRRINIDPGYITQAKLVLATTKDYSHRIHLAKGIYGDVHLNIYKGKFKPNPWTYLDYKEEFVLQFFEEVRKIYLESLPYQT
jgi:hypothetical protein